MRGALRRWMQRGRQGEAGIERGVEEDEVLELEQQGILAEKERVHGGGEAFGPHGLGAMSVPERIGKRHGLAQAGAAHPEIHQLAGHDGRRIDKACFGCRQPHACEKRERPEQESEMVVAIGGGVPEGMGFRQVEHARRIGHGTDVPATTAEMRNLLRRGVYPVGFHALGADHRHRFFQVGKRADLDIADGKRERRWVVSELNVHPRPAFLCQASLLRMVPRMGNPIFQK